MSVFLQLTDKLAIKSDTRQWMLCKPDGVDKDGSIKWKGFSFPATLEHAVNSAGQYMLRDCDATTYDELVKAADQISRLLSQKFTASATITLKS